MSTQVHADGAGQASAPAATALRFEVATLGVTDVDRAGDRWLLQEITQRLSGRVW